MSGGIDLEGVYARLLAAYGPQGWWPADSPFEMMLGAILTQNTSWTNVERAIDGLRAAGLLDAKKIFACDETELAEIIRPSGYFNQKAHRLRLFSAFYLEQGGMEGFRGIAEPRHALLALHGIGPETADSMLLYALDIPTFVIDAYTRRIFARLGLTAPDATYHALQECFQAGLPTDLELYREYHALIVMHAKSHCRTRPLCSGCPLADVCPAARP